MGVRIGGQVGVSAAAENGNNGELNLKERNGEKN
jgi:hypothetical protein